MRDLAIAIGSQKSFQRIHCIGRDRERAFTAQRQILCDHCQPTSIGRNKIQIILFRPLEMDAIHNVATLIRADCEHRIGQPVGERLLWKCEGLTFQRSLLRREIFGGQSVNGEPRFTVPHFADVVRVHVQGEFHRHRCLRDAEQPARRNTHCTFLCDRCGNFAGDRDVKIRGGDDEPSFLRFEMEAIQHRQRGTVFQSATGEFQGFDQAFFRNG